MSLLSIQGTLALGGTAMFFFALAALLGLATKRMETCGPTIFTFTVGFRKNRVLIGAAVPAYFFGGYMISTNILVAIALIAIGSASVILGFAIEFVRDRKRTQVADGLEEWGKTQ